MNNTLTGALLALSLIAAAPAQAQFSSPMRDVENPDRSAYVLNGFATIDPPFVNNFITFTGFPGKRTFIDQVSVRCTTSSNIDQVTQASLVINTGSTMIPMSGPEIVMTRTGAASFGAGSVYVGTTLTKVFLDPVSATVGNSFYLNIFHTDSTKTAICNAFVSGHTLVL